MFDAAFQRLRSHFPAPDRCGLKVHQQPDGRVTFDAYATRGERSAAVAGARTAEAAVEQIEIKLVRDVPRGVL